MDGFSEVARNLALGAAVEARLASDLFSPERSRSPDAEDGDAVAIVGGELFNKGAQAMTFSVVDELSERFPDHDVRLLSKRDYERDPEELAQYAFDVLPWGPEVQLSLLSDRLDWCNTDRYGDAVEDVRATLRRCSFVVDVNGYRMSSQMGFNATLSQLVSILLARQYDVPIHLLPQSIGPFDYQLHERLVLAPLMQVYLSYPETICTREQAGRDWLAPYTAGNVRTEFDLVLHHEEYDLEHVYDGQPELSSYDLRPDAVGVVPNAKVFDRADHERLYALYESIVERLVDAGRPVYVLPHSAEDHGYCREIAGRFPASDDVRRIEEDCNAIELESIVEQFDFVVASRYHSIVHAYKHHVPAVAIGWAPKYGELLDAFDQSRYHVDVREGVVEDGVVEAVDRLADAHAEESDAIRERLAEIRRRDLFDTVFGR